MTLNDYFFQEIQKFLIKETRENGREIIGYLFDGKRLQIDFKPEFQKCVICGRGFENNLLLFNHLKELHGAK